MPKGHSSAGPDRLTYRQSGVDIAAGDAFVKVIAPLTGSTRRLGADGDIGGFAGLFDLKAAGFRDPLLVAATDGVGTKLKISIEAGKHDTVGIDLVAMCVNDIVVQGAEPLFFLDYYATARLEPEIAAAVVAGIAEGCRQSGCALIGGETAEMPGMYQTGDYDLAGFSVGAAERGRLLPRDDMAVGDALISLASSGAHSNGFSLVRRFVEAAGTGYDAPCPWAGEQSLGHALLTPTRIYVRPILRAKADTGAIKALAHITGGGIAGNLSRVMPDNLSARVDLSALPRLDLFGWLAGSGMIQLDEMLATFNCGAGMIVVVEQSAASVVIESLNKAGEQASVLGAIEDRTDQEAVTFQGQPWWID